MLKASEANTDPYLELLAVRNTLSEIIGLSRAQRMFNRKARTNLTIVSNLLQPEVKDAKSKLFKRKAKELLISGMQYLSKINLTKGYWQIPVAPEDVYKTAFVIPDGQYEFLWMHLGW